MTQDITIVRGTTNTFNITLTDANGSPYVLASGEKLIFGVKRDKYNTAYDVSKTLTSSDYSGGKYVLTLAPSDTENLNFGRYYYDIGLQTGSNYYNVVKCSNFDVSDNITKRVVG